MEGFLNTQQGIVESSVLILLMPYSQITYLHQLALIEILNLQ